MMREFKIPSVLDDNGAVKKSYLVWSKWSGASGEQLAMQLK